MRVAPAILALALIGCSDGAKTWTEAEIEDIAADSAPVDTEALEARLSQLETELAELRRGQADTSGDLSKLAQVELEEARATREEIDRLDYNDEVTRKSPNEVRSRMGMGTHALNSR